MFFLRGFIDNVVFYYNRIERRRIEHEEIWRQLEDLNLKKQEEKEKAERKRRSND